MKWLQFIIPISPSIEEACSNRLLELGATAAFTYLSPDGSLFLLHGIFPRESNQERIKQAISDYLSSLQGLSLDIPAGEIVVKEIDEGVYLNQWKEYFQPIHFGNDLVVEPVWISGSARPGEKILKIDPGMAFGTGHHFTTQFCLQWLCEQKNRLRSLVDVGCGSGIVAIAAALLGIEQVLALDYDPAVMPSAKRNIERNCMEGNILLVAADILLPPFRKKFDAVIANLHTNLLIEAKENLISLLKPGSSLVLTGIGHGRREEIFQGYAELSLQAVQEDPHEEWIGIWYQK
ncbi:MAG: 50S ribosomal protein L11 methyltransferase [bacterium]